jgi:hypothetical protein
VGHDRFSRFDVPPRTRISKPAYLLEVSELGDLIAMTTANGSDRFYSSIPVFRGFGKLMDPALYSPLPARGVILSVLVMPIAAADPTAFRKLIEDIVALVERSPTRGGQCRPAVRGCDGRRPASNSKPAPRAAVRCSSAALSCSPTRCLSIW